MCDLVAFCVTYAADRAACGMLSVGTYIFNSVAYIKYAFVPHSFYHY